MENDFVTIDKKVVLLDLNYTLVANSLQLRGKPRSYRIKHERYRLWLIDALRAMNPRATILLTVRAISEKEWTLKSVKEKTGWEPDGSLFNTMGGIRPQDWKEHCLKEYIFPEFGENPDLYLPIESNLDTWEMYQRYGIKGWKCQPHSERDVMEDVEDAIDQQRPKLF